ncbi:MAG: phosphate uptake regulator PhoU [Archaeoglobaceae archaeon]
MEARKIFKSGRGSYILTLPKSWIQNLGVREGDYVYLKTEKDKIIIFLREKKAKKAEFFCENLSFDAVVRRIIAHYLAGIDVMKIRITSEEQRRAIAFASDLLIGAEVLEDLGNEIELSIQIDPDKMSLEDISEKLFRVCHGMLLDLVGCLFNYRREVISSIITREDEVDRLHFLILRLAKENVFLRTFARTLERVADHIELMAESILNLGKSLELKFVEEIPHVFKSAYMSFLKKDSNFAEEVLERIESLRRHLISHQRKLMDFKKEEIILVKAILDGFQRILAYSSDIAEIAINLAVFEKIAE